MLRERDAAVNGGQLAATVSRAVRPGLPESAMETDRTIVFGATGQIGAALVPALRRRHGGAPVIAVGHQKDPPRSLGAGPYEVLDVTDAAAVRTLLLRHRPGAVYHLAALLSAVGEEHPERAWRVNVDGLRNVLEACREVEGVRLFWPSSIAVFGPDAPKDGTPEDAPTRPTTMYGITKVTGEMLCRYARDRYGVDVRGLRYPGVVSSETAPGGGTTDWAVAMFHGALSGGRYTCFVREDTAMPMIYVADCVRAAIELMDADRGSLERGIGYNLAALTFSPRELASSIAKRVDGFECRYEPDFRQAIADGWPRTLDDTSARREWGWSERVGLESMVDLMLEGLRG